MQRWKRFLPTSCTWLGVKAMRWSILMHLSSENRLCSEPSISWLMVYLSALTGTLRVTELSKTFSCRGTRSRCCWVFPINKSSLVQPLFDRSSVNYGGCLVIFCVVNPRSLAEYSVAWCFPHKQSGVMYHIPRCRLVMRHKNEWNASLSLICSICRIAPPWCFCFFSAGMVKSRLRSALIR